MRERLVRERFGRNFLVVDALAAIGVGRTIAKLGAPWLGNSRCRRTIGVLTLDYRQVGIIGSRRLADPDVVR